MLVLFKNVTVDGVLLDAAVPTGKIVDVSRCGKAETKIAYTSFDDELAILAIMLPIEQVVGLINQAMGAVAVPDAPEKSVVVITGKDGK